ACLLCGAATESVLDGIADWRFGSPGTWHIVHCRACGLEQTAPRPTGPELKMLYETFYNYGGEKGTRYTGWRDRFFASKFYRQAGFKPEGLELNAHAAEAARRRGFMVYETDLAHLKPSLPFDRLVLSNVLEHML